MSASYPGALKSFTTKTNKVDLVDAAHINDLQAEVVAIETELGIDVAGSCTDLKTRLAVMIADDGTFQKGTSFPGSPLEGQMFYRTDEDTPYIYDGAAWDSLLAVADAAVSQVKLKTSTGEVSTLDPGANLTLPGGEYGFYPQVKYSQSNGGAHIATGLYSSSYVTNIYLIRDTGTAYAQQRYVAASGRDHWIFLLVDKQTKLIVASYQAPDHPSANLGGLTELDLPHPFGNYDPAKHEIVVVDNDILHSLKSLISRRDSLLTLINDRCIIDDTQRPSFEAREIIKIDEIGDIEGEVIKRMRVPQWAKIVIGAEEISLKRRMVERLPENILYKKLILMGER